MLLDGVGARLVFLPTYSPELNPCELVFGQVKNYLPFRRGHRSFLNEMALGFAEVSWQNVFNYYSKCIEKFDEM